MLYFSFLAGGAPDAGWFSYAPLTEKDYSPSLGIDYWALSLLVMGAGSVATGINLIVTILTLRTPGMTLQRLPLFVWMMFIDAFLVVLAVPALNAALAMILIDRQLNAHFFNPAEGGSALLWQNYFWMFGHPEVYILILPAFGADLGSHPGLLSEGHLRIRFHGRFDGGHRLSKLRSLDSPHVRHRAEHGYSICRLRGAAWLIAVPTGIKIFNWIATMWGGSIRFTTAMLFATAFLIQFTVGGLSGVAFASVPIDWQLTDSYFVVAHIHYVLLGGMLFGMFAGTYYWFPKMTGRLLSERLGKLHFWLLVLGFNGTFAGMHVLGVLGHAPASLHLSRPSSSGPAPTDFDPLCVRAGGGNPGVRVERGEEPSKRSSRG